MQSACKTNLRRYGANQDRVVAWVPTLRFAFFVVELIHAHSQVHFEFLDRLCIEDVEDLATAFDDTC